MTSLIAPVLYTEANLHVEPTFPGATFHIPTEGTSFFSPRKRIRLDDAVDQDDETYSRRHLATESSIFFRRKGRAPRSFLWRVLDDRKALQIQSVDLVQPRQSHQESILTYNLSFANPIRHNGIAFADPEEHDALDIFVLTTSNELYTFSLRKDLLARASVPSSSDFDPSTCFKTFTPSSFSFRHPYKLVALSSHELLVSLHDGGLLRLDKRAGDNGLMWRETFFSEGGWGSSLRGLIPWKGHNTVRFDDVDLEASTAAAMEPSPDASHVFTVSLDHTLKAWNKKSGKIGVQTDLLGEVHKDPNAAARYLIGPTQGTMIKVLDVVDKPDGDMYYIVTNSPKGHEFKFWGIRDADSAAHGIRDIQPDVRFIPPLDELMNTNVWQLADFHVQPGPSWRDTQIWIRARFGAICRTFTVTFDLLSTSEDIEDAWHNKWVAIDEGSLSVEHLIATSHFPKDMNTNDAIASSSSATDHWLDFLFFPGRFNTNMIETALQIYRKGLNLMTGSRNAEANKPLKERLCTAIAAKVVVKKSSNGNTDVGRYHKDITSQWTVFFGLVRHLHERHLESLSLAFDVATGLAWSVRAGQVGPIRTCSESEVLCYNENIFTTQEDEWIVNSLPLADSLPNESCLSVARLLAAARTFRGSMSVAFNQSLTRAASMNALKDAGEDARSRTARSDDHALVEIFETCGFGNEVGDEDFNRLTDAMQDLGGLDKLDNDLVFQTLDRLTETSHGHAEDHALTRYGARTTIRGAQEMLALGHDILLDLLALVVFLSQDLEPDDLSPGFEPIELYSLLITKIKEHDVLLWLARHVRQEPSNERRTSVGDISQLRKTSEQPTLTLFESIFIGDWEDMRFPDEPLPALITYWCRAWTCGPPLTTDYNGITAHIMGNLLKHGNYTLATDFMRFLPNNSWTMYLRGRLYLAEGEYFYAAEYFERACDGLSERTAVQIESLDTASLLPSTARSLFGEGAPRYYLHIVALFEAAKLVSYAADFAMMALDSLDDNDADTSIVDFDKRKRSMQGSPAAMQVDLAMEEIRLLRVQDLREDILNRLFNASLQTGRYQQAFEALVKFGNPVLRKASLQSLIQSLLKTQSTSLLLSLSFPPELIPEVDSILLSLARKHLSSSSTTTTTSPSGLATPQYVSILYAWRIQNDDFRGAAEVLYERLQRLKVAKGRNFEDEEDEELMGLYLVLLNTLACCGPDEGWILAERVDAEQQIPGAAKAQTPVSFARRLGNAVLGSSGGDGGAQDGSGAGEVEKTKEPKRKIITLEDVRREYQAELDRRSEILQGRFAITGDAMDVL